MFVGTKQGEFWMQSYTLYVWGAGIGMLVAWSAILVLRPFAKRLNLMDHPGGRKHHQHQTPLIGGLIIFLGMCASFISLPIPSTVYLGMMLGTSALIAVGVIDDFIEIRPRFRFVAQIIAAFCLILISHCAINYLGGMFFFPNFYLSALSVPVTVFLVVGFINAVNMLDGQDGLAGGVIFTETLLLFFVSIYLKEFTLSLLLFVFLSLNVVFLCFNAPLPWRRHASIFLGDSGSNFLAFFVAWIVITLSQLESSFIKPVTLAWVVGFPFFDMTSACLIRRRSGKSWFDPSHDHIHHLLQRRNIPLFWSTFGLSMLSLALGSTGFFLAWMHVAEGWQFILFLGALGSYLSFTKRLNTDEKEMPYDDGGLQLDG